MQAFLAGGALGRALTGVAVAHSFRSSWPAVCEVGLSNHAGLAGLLRASLRMPAACQRRRRLGGCTPCTQCNPSVRIS